LGVLLESRGALVLEQERQQDLVCGFPIRKLGWPTGIVLFVFKTLLALQTLSTTAIMLKLAAEEAAIASMHPCHKIGERGLSLHPDLEFGPHRSCFSKLSNSW
jgi:hypothetical protein